MSAQAVRYVMTRLSQTSCNILSETKAKQIAAQEERTQARLRELARTPPIVVPLTGHISSCIDYETSHSVIAQARPRDNTLWSAVLLGPSHFVWTRTGVNGQDEWFTASQTATGEWELSQSSN